MRFMLRSRHAWAQVVFGALLAPVVTAACATSGGSGPEVVRPRANATAADYYPLANGWKWAFDVEQDGVNILATYAVLERNGDVAVVQAGDEKLMYAVTPEGVAQKDGDMMGDYVIKNPLRAGTEWNVAGGRAKITSVTEEVNVDSVGRYAGCVVVEVTRVSPMRVTRTTFAPDLGPIALEMQVQDGQTFKTTTRAKLRAVTKPGDAMTP
jgi:hypothetical protein